MNFLFIYADPSSPRNVRLSEVKPSSVTVTWEIPQTTNGIIQKYQIWYQITHSNERKFIFKNFIHQTYRYFFSLWGRFVEFHQFSIISKYTEISKYQALSTIVMSFENYFQDLADVISF